MGFWILDCGLMIVFPPKRRGRNAGRPTPPPRSVREELSRLAGLLPQVITPKRTKRIRVTDTECQRVRPPFDYS